VVPLGAAAPEGGVGFLGVDVTVKYRMIPPPFGTEVFIFIDILDGSRQTYMLKIMKNGVLGVRLYQCAVFIQNLHTGYPLLNAQ